MRWIQDEVSQPPTTGRLTATHISRNYASKARNVRCDYSSKIAHATEHGSVRADPNSRREGPETGQSSTITNGSSYNSRTKVVTVLQSRGRYAQEN